MECRDPVLSPFGWRLPRGNLGFYLPASCSPGSRALEDAGAARVQAGKSCAPDTRFLRPAPTPRTSPHSSLLKPRRRRGPRGQSGEAPPAAWAPAENAPSPRLSPWSLKGACGWRVTAQTGRSPEKQEGAEVRVQQRVGIHLRVHQVHLASGHRRGRGDRRGLRRGTKGYYYKAPPKWDFIGSPGSF